MLPLRKVPWIRTGWFLGGYVRTCSRCSGLQHFQSTLSLRWRGALAPTSQSKVSWIWFHHQILLQVLPLALVVLCRHLIQWWFGSSLLGFAAIDKQINLKNILAILFPRSDTLDWAKRQTIQNEIHFKLKPNFPLCSKGKDARLFRTNFLLITIEKKGVKHNLADGSFLPPKTSTELSLSYPLFNSRNEIQSYLRVWEMSFIKHNNNVPVIFYKHTEASWDVNG